MNLEVHSALVDRRQEPAKWFVNVEIDFGHRIGFYKTNNTIPYLLRLNTFVSRCTLLYVDLTNRA